MAGFVGQVNVYTCGSCGGQTVTIDRDAGVTPMYLDCRADGAEPRTRCRGRATSAWYRPTLPHPEPAWEWYRPTAKELRGIKDRALRDHAESGGLLLRRIAREGRDA